MKKVIFAFILLILLSVPVYAKTIEKELSEKGNVEVPGYNITLMLIGNKERSIVVCVNNEKRIIDKSSKLSLENLKVEPLRIYPNNVKLKITYSCEECICNESCSNNLCFPQPKEQQINESQVTQQKVIQQETNQKNDNITAISIALILIVLALLIVLLLKKRKR